jgi:hypothetical protein
MACIPAVWHASFVFSVAFFMDKMIGADFDKGLTSMKQIVESPKAGPPG